MTISLSQLEDREHELQQLLFSREETLVDYSRALSLCTAPLCCCYFLRDFEPKKKIHFVCTVLDPCLCCYKAATNKEKYLLPPERQEMEEVSKKIVAIVQENRRSSFMAQFLSVASTENSVSRRDSSEVFVGKVDSESPPENQEHSSEVFVGKVDSEKAPVQPPPEDPDDNRDWEYYGGRFLSSEPVFKQDSRPILDFMRELNAR